MPKREDSLLLNDIIICIEKIYTYTNNYTFDDFINDEKTIDAVVRNFEIIGEASKLISEETKLANKLIEWRMMTDFRNILIHEYFGVDYKAVWDAIQESLPYNYEFLKRIA